MNLNRHNFTTLIYIERENNTKKSIESVNEPLIGLPFPVLVVPALVDKSKFVSVLFQ